MRSSVTYECQGRCWVCGGTTEGIVILVGWRGCEVAMLDAEMAWTMEIMLDQLSRYLLLQRRSIGQGSGKADRSRYGCCRPVV